jgi:circadian clock protein KaiC
MSTRDRVSIRKLPSGVPGLDAVLGGGLPEFSFNVIAGDPGAGKTTLANQIVFANATGERPGLYVTLLGEPTIKLLRYQQQMRFFDVEKVGSVVHFVNLGQEMIGRDLRRILAAIVGEAERRRPALVVVDSFRTTARGPVASATDQMDFAAFVQQLGLHMAGWQATTFLVGEWHDIEQYDDPVFSVADNILWLTQPVERNSSIRKLRVVKVRGQARIPGLHSYRISDDGIQVFPRMLERQPDPRLRPMPLQRLSTGIAGLDEMLGGGIPAGDTVLVAGPGGTGKTQVALHFVLEGARRGEPGVVAVFEEHRQEYWERARVLGVDLDGLVRGGRLAFLYLRPLDVSIAETMMDIREAVARIGATRVVLDSLSNLEQALAPSFRHDFHESPYRLVRDLSAGDVTVVMTLGASEFFTDVSLDPHALSFLIDDIVLQRYVEIGGERRRAMEVVKARSSDHSKELREYEITATGLVVRGRLRELDGLGHAERDRTDRDRPHRDRPDRGR